MALITITNSSIANTGIADVTKLTQNDNDLVNGLTDGTKDISIGDITLNASPNLISDLLPTTDTYVLGNTTYAFKSITLNNGSTDGGKIQFDAGTNLKIQAVAAGTSLRFYNGGNIVASAESDGLLIPSGYALRFTAGSAPASPVTGMVYYDSVANKLKVYTGAGWETISST